MLETAKKLVELEKENFSDKKPEKGKAKNERGGSEKYQTSRKERIFSQKCVKKGVSVKSWRKISIKNTSGERTLWERFLA